MVQSRHHGWCERPAVTGRDRQGLGWQTLRSFCDVITVGLAGNKLLPSSLSSEDGGRRHFALFAKTEKSRTDTSATPKHSQMLLGCIGPLDLCHLARCFN